MKLLRFSIIILFLFFTLNCVIKGHFAASDANKQYAGKKTPDQILVYRSQVPKRKFIEIGIVHVCCSDNAKKLVYALKKKAAYNGGDAIIHLESSPERMTATVIRFIERK